MDTTWDGKKIKSIWFNGANGDNVLKAEENLTLQLDASYHGDRDEFWVSQINSEGVEIARHNCKYITTIEWL